MDLIIQSIHEMNANDIAFTVTQAAIDRAEAVAEAIAPVFRTDPLEHQQAEVMVDRGVAKVSIAGAGMIGRPGVAARMFATLAAAGVNIRMISTSEVQVSCLIGVEDCDRALQSLCRTFEIDRSPLNAATAHSQTATAETLPVVRGVALDLKQARLAIRRVPDRPGMAANLFQPLAQQGISVDMIIQSQRCRVADGIPTRDIAFTTAEGEAETARSILETVGTALGCGAGLAEESVVLVDRAIAKVSAVGAGMEVQAGVAARMFEALAQRNINIQMIATSEIKISCAVAREQGIEALKAIHAAFHLGNGE